MANKDTISVRVENPNQIRINLGSPKGININMDDRLVIRTGTSDHSQLSNLDYENSGHTGFMPKKLSLLNPLPNNSQTQNLRLVLFDTSTEESYKATIGDVRNRIIKTESSSYVNTEEGQYVFVEIND